MRTKGATLTPLTDVSTTHSPYDCPTGFEFTCHAPTSTAYTLSILHDVLNTSEICSLVRYEDIR